MARATPSNGPPMTPHEALHALGDLPRYEERLTAKAAGMTAMVWGLAIAGMFMTYTAIDPWLQSRAADGPLYSLYAVLWLPWVAAGITLSGAVWNAHAISVRRAPENRKGLLLSAGLTALFFVLLAAVLVVKEVLLDSHWNWNLTMVLVSGLFAMAYGAWQVRGPACAVGVGVLAGGLGMVVFAFAVGPLGWRSDASGLLGGLLAGLTWFVPGLVGFLKG